MESTLNYSITPLAADRAYIGKWEKALYTTATITLLADTTCEIVAYQSLNKTQEQITSFQTLANQYNTFNLVLDLPYVYFSVRNNSATDQTLLNFSVIYKNVYIPPAGNSLYDLLNTKGTLQLYNNSILAGGTTASLDCSVKKISNLTFYGSQNSNGNVLTVQFSNNGSNWYDTQYTYTFGLNNSGSFGWSIQACPYYVRVKSANACNLNIQCDYC